MLKSTYSLPISSICNALIVVGLAVILTASAARAADNNDRADNSGRRLAVVPKIEAPEGRSLSTITVEAERIGQSILDGLRDLTPRVKGNRVTMELPFQIEDISLPRLSDLDMPPAVEDAGARCIYYGQRAMVTLREHAIELGGWMAQHLRQLTSTPRMTPAGAPYTIDSSLVQSDFGVNNIKKYLTSEGRLKTVTNR